MCLRTPGLHSTLKEEEGEKKQYDSFIAASELWCIPPRRRQWKTSIHLLSRSPRLRVTPSSSSMRLPPSLPPHQKPILTPKKLSGKQEGEGWLRPRVRGEGHQIMRGGTGGGAKKDYRGGGLLMLLHLWRHLPLFSPNRKPPSNTPSCLLGGDPPSFRPPPLFPTLRFPPLPLTQEGPWRVVWGSVVVREGGI